MDKTASPSDRPDLARARDRGFQGVGLWMINCALFTLACLVMAEVVRLEMRDRPPAPAPAKNPPAP